MDVTHAVLCIALLTSLATAAWFYAEAASLREDLNALTADYENLCDVADSYRETSDEAATPLRIELDAFCEEYLARGRQIQDLQVELAQAKATLAEREFILENYRDQMDKILSQTAEAKRDLAELRSLVLTQD